MAEPHADLDALIGPPGTQVGCDECFRMLDQYVERELAGERVEQAMPTMATHLRGCPVCADEHRSLLALVRAEDA